MSRLLTNTALALTIFFLWTGCESKPVQEKISDTVQLLNEGELTQASELSARLLEKTDLSSRERRILDSVNQIAHRINIDFCLSESEVLERLNIYHSGINSIGLRHLENEHKLDFRYVDGEKKYFKNCVGNLFLLDSSYNRLKRMKDGPLKDSLPGFRLRHSSEVVKISKAPGETVHPVRFRLSYKITVDVNAVPPGETIRCWMPYPGENHGRQMNVKLISTNPATYMVSPETDLQRSIYMEKKAVENQPTIFETGIELTSFAQIFPLSPENIMPYQTNSNLYKEFTAEKPPHITFSKLIKDLSNNILKDETNPLLKVRKIYQWINDSVTWASAIEYSILEDIPGFVIRKRHGDCGMQTLLFMTLARNAGIPVKWQSGWMLHPGYVNLHDWCEVYFEGVGWVPLDQSFGLQESPDPKLRNFYITGIDAYRFIVNDEISSPLSPAKHYLRSEPYDFQRGELEWRGGNLYFDKWSWHMDVSYQ